MANQHFQALWVACVQKHTKTPMNWQTVADDYARAIVEHCIKTVEPTQAHLAYPDNYLGSYDGLELLEAKVIKLKELLK